MDKKKILFLILMLTALVMLSSCGQHEHEFGEWTVAKEATCSEKGIRERLCQTCGAKETEDIPSTAHTETILKGTPATCFEDGISDGKYCTVCGKVTEAQHIVLALGHQAVIDEAVAPTFAETGLTEGKHCALCGSVIVAQKTVRALGIRSYGNGIFYACPFEDADTVKITSQINSRYAIVVDNETGRIIAEKDSDFKANPASMAKILTAVVAYESITEKGTSFDTKLTVSREIIEQCASEGSATAGFISNETVTIDDLFHGMIMLSGADAVYTLAEYCAGTVDAFVVKMNDKASELGLENSVYATPTGLSGNACSLKDMASVLSYALNYPYLRSLFTADSYTVAKTNKQAQRVFDNPITQRRKQYSSNLKLSALDYAVEFGGKTGYTNQALSCMATYIKDKDGDEYIVITAKADNGGHTVSDYKYLYDTFVKDYREDEKTGGIKTDAGKTKYTDPYEDNSTVNISAGINSKYAIVVDNNTGRIIAKKDCFQRIDASPITDITAALVLYEYIRDNGMNIDSKILVPERDISVSTTAFAPNETVSIRDLFYGILLQSGKDAILTLAEHCFGSEAGLVAKMNDKVKALGLTKTNFVSVDGEGNYTTLENAATVLSYAMKYDFLKKVMTSESYYVDAENRFIVNPVFAINKKGQKEEKLTFAETLGGSAGNTSRFGGYMASFITAAGKKEYIVISAKASDGAYPASDSRYLYEKFIG